MKVLVQLEESSLINVVLCSNIFTGNIIRSDGVEPLAVGVNLVDQSQTLRFNLLLRKSVFGRSTRVGRRAGRRISLSGSSISSRSSRSSIRRRALLFSKAALSLSLGSFNAKLVTSVDVARLIKVNNLVDSGKDFRSNVLSLGKSSTSGGFNSY